MTERLPKPAWLKRRFPAPGLEAAVNQVLSGLSLRTVCQEAGCPNRGECFSRGTATFLLLGPSCTRRCSFCLVDKGPPAPPDPDEPERTARAAARMGLDYSVLTMVSRDDLSDGGAGHVARTVKAVGRACPEVPVEALISDLGGDEAALAAVLEAGPQVLNHNLETVPRLYDAVRPQALYDRSLELLERAARHRPRPVTKSGLMLGLGETRDEVLETLRDLRSVGCDAVTLGQYLAPSSSHHPVVRFVPPTEFEELAAQAKDLGFSSWASGPYVRSSYQAAQLFRQASGQENRS